MMQLRWCIEVYGVALYSSSDPVGVNATNLGMAFEGLIHPPSRVWPGPVVIATGHVVPVDDLLGTCMLVDKVANRSELP